MLPSHTNQLINWVFQYFKQTVFFPFEMVENPQALHKFDSLLIYNITLLMFTDLLIYII